MPKSRPQFGLPQIKNRAKQTTKIVVRWSQRGVLRISRRLRRICDVCGAFAGHDQPSFPVCGGCDARRYCGEAFQIIDWEFRGHARKCQMSADLQEVLDALADDEV